MMAARDVTVCSPRLKVDQDLPETVCLRLQYPDSLGPVENDALQGLLDQLGGPPQCYVSTYLVTIYY